jgi:hypothetical protein
MKAINLRVKPRTDETPLLKGEGGLLDKGLVNALDDIHKVVPVLRQLKEKTGQGTDPRQGLSQGRKGLKRAAKVAEVSRGRGPEVETAEEALHVSDPLQKFTQPSSGLFSIDERSDGLMARHDRLEADEGMKEPIPKAPASHGSQGVIYELEE